MEQNKRTIKSYVLRRAKITKGQEKAFELLLPKYALDPKSSPINFEKVFLNENPCVLEIGFGMGASLFEMANNNPNINFIGVEVHEAGVGKFLSLVDKHDLKNVRVFCFDAVEILKNCIKDNSLDKVQIFFPDPWHKKKHNKRRLIQKEFVDLLSKKIKEEGILHIATDWEDYAQQILEVLQSTKSLANMHGADQFAKNIIRPETKFEKRGKDLGHGVWDLEFIKQQNLSSQP